MLTIGSASHQTREVLADAGYQTQADVERESLALAAVLAKLVAMKSPTFIALTDMPLPGEMSADESAAWQARLPSQPELRAAQMRVERVGVLAELTETLYRPAPRGRNGPERPGEPRPQRTKRRGTA